MPKREPGRLRVLWATDGSESAANAIPLLRALVLPNCERLVVLTVATHSFISGVRPDPAFLMGLSGGARRKALTESEEAAREAVQQLAPDSSIAVEALARWGNPIEQFLRESRS